MQTLINYVLDDQGQRHICLSHRAFVCDGVISNDSYHKLKQRGNLQVIGRGGNGNQVWIIYSSLPEKYKEAILSHYRSLYKDSEWTPVKQLQNNIIKEHLVLRVEDEKALKDFRKEDGLQLPNDFITKYLTACKYLSLLDDTTPKKAKAMGFASMKDFNLAFISLLKSENVSLPKEYAPLRKKLARYREVRALCVVNGRIGNDNSRKVNNDAEEWLVSMYSLPKIWSYMTLFFEYNKVAPIKGWKPLESEQTVYNILNTPENRQKWYGSREGWHKDHEVHGIQLKTKHPTFRDALWFGDGTGWNYQLANDGKRVNQHNCYWVMDTYSEVLLGWHISENESHESVYKALRQSIKHSGGKPYEMRYDNGGGHTKKEVQEFFTRAALHHFPCQPYNGKSKPIENLTGRFQQQVMNRDWFFTGQNRTAHTERSQANWEFILDNLDQVPTITEMKLLFAERVKEWNNAPHPKYKRPRIELYNESVNPVMKPVDELDMVNIFYLRSEEPRVYMAPGIMLEVKGQKLTYEVYKDTPMAGPEAQKREVDMDFRKNYLGERFYRYYDLEDLSFIYLFIKDHNGMQFVAKAELKVENHLALIDHQPGEAAVIKDLQRQRKESQAERKAIIKELQEKTGITPERMMRETREKAQELSMAQIYKEGARPNLSGLLYGTEADEGRELDE